VCSVLEPRDPLWVARTPYGGVRIPFKGSGPYTWGFWTNLEGPDYISKGPALSHGGPGSLLIPWSISLSLDTWRLRTRPCGGVRRCGGPRVVTRGWGESWLGLIYSTFTTRLRDSCAGTASLYSSKGYPSFRVPTKQVQNKKKYSITSIKNNLHMCLGLPDHKSHHHYQPFHSQHHLKAQVRH
jgi:hypothetical protein